MIIDKYQAFKTYDTRAYPLYQNYRAIARTGIRFYPPQTWHFFSKAKGYVGKLRIRKLLQFQNIKSMRAKRAKAQRNIAEKELKCGF